MEKHPNTSKNLYAWGAAAILTWLTAAIHLPKNFEGGFYTVCLATACSCCWGAWHHINKLEKANPS